MKSKKSEKLARAINSQVKAGAEAVASVVSALGEPVRVSVRTLTDEQPLELEFPLTWFISKREPSRKKKAK